MALSAVKKETARNPHAADTPPAVQAGAKKSRKLLKLLIIFVITSSLGGGGAYWYLHQHKGGKPGEAKAQPAKPPVFVPLEVFTVNLQLEENPQFLQAGLSLKVSDNSVTEALKIHMPEVRDRILLLLSARKASELLTVNGKRKLGTDIVDTVNAILAPPAAGAEPAAAAPKEAPAPAEGKAATAAESAEPPAEAAVAASVPAPLPAPVLSVLFTSFIIQ